MSTNNSSATTPLSGGSKSRRKAVSGIVAVGATAAALILAAPSAQAAVTEIQVAPGPSFGTSAQHGSGCTYKVSIAATPGEPVFFYDEAPATFNKLTGVPGETIVTVLWTPHGAGPHKIYAFQKGNVKWESTMVDVAVGHDFGSSCWALPF